MGFSSIKAPEYRIERISLTFKRVGRGSGFTGIDHTARSFRVFPGEGAHTAQLAQLVRALGATGYQGDMSFEVFNDDYLQMPLETVAARARRSAAWLTEEVLQSPAALAVVMR